MVLSVVTHGVQQSSGDFKAELLAFYKWAVTAYVRPAVIVSQLHDADKRGRS